MKWLEKYFKKNAKLVRLMILMWVDVTVLYSRTRCALQHSVGGHQPCAQPDGGGCYRLSQHFLHKIQLSLLVYRAAVVGPQIFYAFLITLLTVHQYPGLQFTAWHCAGYFGKYEFVAD